MKRRNFFKMLVAMYGIIGLGAYAKETKQVIEKDEDRVFNKSCLIGLGGGGTNIIDIMSKLEPRHRYIHMNSDYNSLKQKRSKNKILLGWNKKFGLGCGGKVECGIDLINDKVKMSINNLVKDIDTVHVVSSIGGGLGSGATPEIVKYLKEIDKKVFVYVTVPFSFEGRKRLSIAYESIDKIKKSANKLVVFKNDDLIKNPPPLGLRDSFNIISTAMLKIISI